MLLDQKHRDTLVASGICETCIEKLALDGVAVTTADGLRLNYPESGGFYRIRLDEPKGKMKYTQEAGTGCRLFFAPGYNRWNVGLEALIITEGEKKALTLDCRLKGKVGVLGVGGVWNWTGGKDQDRRILIGDFNRVHLRERLVYIVFDSDAETNPQVLKAERQLAKALTEKGARVRIIILPPERKGIDDWLVAWGDNWREEFRRLAGEALPSRMADKYKSIYSQVYSFGDMVGKKFPIPKFFAGDDSFGLVGQGMVMILHGPTNVGKTYMSTQLAMSISSGLPWLGHTCKRSKVLVFQGELPPGMYAKSRLKPLVDRLGIPDNISFYNWSFNFAESSRFKETFAGEAWQGFDEFEHMLDEYTPEVVVIDPLQSYHNLVETSNDQLRELLKKLKKIAMARNLGIIIVDHDRKAPGDGTNQVRGASAKTDLADTVIGIQRGEDGEIMLYYDKVRYIGRALPGPSEIHMKDSFFELGADPYRYKEGDQE